MLRNVNVFVVWNFYFCSMIFLKIFFDWNLCIVIIKGSMCLRLFYVNVEYLGIVSV